mmetsp:Transcript_28562/g.38975  ORF Transcript_28562/g.38975 Transcript_28562/m.38975 type:complete len:330 (-) Transcript_28562:1541-2530(-)
MTFPEASQMQNSNLNIPPSPSLRACCQPPKFSPPWSPLKRDRLLGTRPGIFATEVSDGTNSRSLNICVTAHAHISAVLPSRLISGFGYLFWKVLTRYIPSMPLGADLKTRDPPTPKLPAISSLRPKVLRSHDTCKPHTRVLRSTFISFVSRMKAHKRPRCRSLANVEAGTVRRREAELPLVLRKLSKERIVAAALVLGMPPAVTMWRVANAPRSVRCDCARDDFFISMRLAGELELAAAHAASLSRRILSSFLLCVRALFFLDLRMVALNFCCCAALFWSKRSESWSTWFCTLQAAASSSISLRSFSSFSMYCHWRTACPSARSKPACN